MKTPANLKLYKKMFGHLGQKITVFFSLRDLSLIASLLESFVYDKKTPI